MAAPEAAWNRLDVPWPAGSSAVPVAAQHPAVRALPTLRRRCAAAIARLSGRGPAVEGRVLRAVLYVYHSRLLRHRPFLAMQQVEQCLKRLWKMNLVGCIQTLAEVIARKNTAQAQAECLVPSQPMLETVAVKVLGGCKLILRLLDCCCKAFLLSVKHLCSEEFILMNTVASGLLSRLCLPDIWYSLQQAVPLLMLTWTGAIQLFSNTAESSRKIVLLVSLHSRAALRKVQYRCVLGSLISLYSVLWTSLRLVSETQQMPYIEGFTFPSDISNFLGVNLSSEVKKQKAKMLTAKRPTGWLKKLFPTVPEAVPKAGRKRDFVTHASALEKYSIPTDDIGEPVLVTRNSRGMHLGADVKSLLRPPRPPTQEGRRITSSSKETSASLSSSVANLQHTGLLVQMFQTAASFGELSEALRKAILWCKGNKLRSAAYFLRNKLLKSNRLHHVEAQGCSLRKKLSCVKTTLCKCLLYGSQNARWPRQYRGAWFCRRRVRLSKCSKETLKTVQQKRSKPFGDWGSGITPVMGPSSGEGRPIGRTASVELSTVGTPKQLLLKGSTGSMQKDSENIDIDSIFAAMGV